MVVTSGRRARGWRSLLRCGLQRGLDTASEVADVVAGKLSALADPRTRLLRKRRWALRLGLFFGFSCVFWAALTVVLAVWGWFALLLVITGLIAAVQAIPATLLLFRYRWLRSTPLPAQRPRGTRRRLPPPGSAARPAMFALGASERGFFSLLAVMERGQMLPANEIRELVRVSKRTAAAMAATAAEVVSMERAMSLTAQSRPALAPTINAFTAQLSGGVRQYNEMVTAAAQLVSSANGGPSPANGGPSPANGGPSPAIGGPSSQRYRDELAGATARLVGWARAFDELGGLPAA